MNSAAHWPTAPSFSFAYWTKLLIGLLNESAHGPILNSSEISFSFAYWTQLPIGLLTSSAHCNTKLCCLLAYWTKLLIGLLNAAAHGPTKLEVHWTTELSCSLAKNVRCSLANCCQLLSDLLLLTSAFHWSTDISCSLDNWDKLLIGQVMSAANWQSDVSCSFTN